MNPTNDIMERLDDSGADDCSLGSRQKITPLNQLSTRPIRGIASFFTTSCTFKIQKTAHPFWYIAYLFSTIVYKTMSKSKG
jgi:hypothetical protein